MDNYSINLDLAIDKFNEKKYFQSIKLLNDELKIMPNNDEIYYWIGRSKFELNLFDESNTYFTKAIEITHKDKYYFWRHKAKEYLGDINSAIKDLKMAISINPDKDTIYRYSLNCIYLKRNIKTKEKYTKKNNQNIEFKRSFSVLLKILISIILIPLVIIFIYLLPILLPLVLIILLIWGIIWFLVWRKPQ